MCALCLATRAIAQSPSLDVDPRGPIVTRDMPVEATPGSVHTVNYKFGNGCTKPQSWTADWIWSEPTGGQGSRPPISVLFRKELKLNAKPTQAKVWVSADVVYRLYVNGRLVSRGPADMGRDYDREDKAPRWMYDYRDLTPYFRPGANVISAEVFSEGFVSSRVSRGKHGFILEAELTSAGNKPVIVKTDESWKCLPDPIWQNGGAGLCSRGRSVRRAIRV